MLRIDRSITNEKFITLSLEGKLLSAWIPEVLGAIASARSSGQIRIDLSQLSFADQEGIELLRRLQHDGVTLKHCTPFIAGLLSRN